LDLITLIILPPPSLQLSLSSFSAPPKKQEGVVLLYEVVDISPSTTRHRENICCRADNSIWFSNRSQTGKEDSSRYCYLQEPPFAYWIYPFFAGLIGGKGIELASKFMLFRICSKSPLPPIKHLEGLTHNIVLQSQIILI